VEAINEINGERPQLHHIPKIDYSPWYDCWNRKRWERVAQTFGFRGISDFMIFSGLNRVLRKLGIRRARGYWRGGKRRRMLVIGDDRNKVEIRGLSRVPRVAEALNAGWNLRQDSLEVGSRAELMVEFRASPYPERI
jgi:hypothetical protein